MIVVVSFFIRHSDFVTLSHIKWRSVRLAMDVCVEGH